ncbi:ABC transporter permease [Aeromicrobium sp. P5_D10]
MGRILVRAGLVAVAVLVAVALILPLVIVVLLSFTDSQFLTFPPDGWSLRWFDNLVSDAAWRQSAISSIKVAVLVSMLSVVLGTAGALGLTRGSFRFRTVLSALVLAPILIPSIVVALAVYNIALTTGLTQTTLGFVLVHTSLAVPYVTINVAAALATYDRQLDLAAMSLGASPWVTFFKVTLPNIAPSVITGALFAFVTSWDEIVVALFISGPEMTTLPVKMWQGVKVSIDPTVAALSSVLLAFTIITFAAMGIVGALRRRRTRPSHQEMRNSA